MARKRTAKKNAGKGARRSAAKARRKPAASRPAARKKARTVARKPPARAARSAASAKPAGRTRAAKKPVRAATLADGMYGEGNWKADEEYRQDLQEWSETHDAEQLAREAEEGLPPDLRDDEDDDLAESARHGAEEEPEW